MAHNTNQSRTSKRSLQNIEAIYESPMGHMADPDLMIHFFQYLCQYAPNKCFCNPAFWVQEYLFAIMA